MTIKILDSIDDKYYFKIIGDNGEPIATSETYTRKEKCMQTARLFEGADIGDFTVRKMKAVKAKPQLDDLQE